MRKPLVLDEIIGSGVIMSALNIKKGLSIMLDFTI